MIQHRVLVVDHSHHIEQMLASGLLNYPIEIAFSLNKEEAVREVLTLQPDLLVTGVSLPDGTAIELLSELTRMLRWVPPSIFIAAVHEAELRNAVLGLGAVDILSRPIQMEELHARMDSVVKLVKPRVISKEKSVIEDFQVVLDESKALGISVTELIKRKQVTID